MGNQYKMAVLSAGIDTIPTLPAMVGQVVRTIADPDSAARDLMEIIHPDQALTLKIIKIANSAFYGRMRKTGTLDQALVVLGFDEIRNLVIAAAVFNNFKSLKATPLFEPTRFWKHSFLCGLAARIIAKEKKLPEGDLFVAGLLHDIGKLVICMVLPLEFNAILEATGSGNLKTSAAEHAVLGFTHAEAGLRLVKRWMLPHDLVASVGYHHRPAEAPTPTADIIHLADLLAHNAMARTAQDRDEAQLGEDLFTPEIVNSALSLRLENHPNTIEKIMAELDVLQEDQAGVMEIFLS